VDAHFFALNKEEASGSVILNPAAESARISRRVADALGPAIQETGASLRFAKPSAFPINMPLGDRHDTRTVRRPIRIQGVQPDSALGRFSLMTDQVPPMNAFVGRDWLSAAAETGHRVNLLLSDAEPAALTAALATCLDPADTGLAITRGVNGVWMVESSRIFIEDAWLRALSDPAVSAGTNTCAPVLALHHLVDAFAADAGGSIRETPYGFISALSPATDARLGVVRPEMANDEIIINAWLAEKLHVGAGDRLTLRWRRFDSNGRLTPDASVFHVTRVLSMAEAAPERSLLPKFPGLTDVDRCSDWDIGLPMETEKLNDPDNEAYWKTYGPTPKAFVTLAAGRLMFGTVFGSAMTARFSPESDETTIREKLLRAQASDLGLVVRPVAAEASRAVAQAMDFRELFISMASVLMVAALILINLLASLGVAQRREEVGILRASGFSARQITYLWLTESCVPLSAGVVVGGLAGAIGARALIWGMNHFWSGAIASAQIPFTVNIQACLVAGLLALMLSLLAVRAGVHRTLRAQPRDLLAGGSSDETTGSFRVLAHFAIGISTTLGALGVLAFALHKPPSQAGGPFFGAGLMLMISLLCFARLLAHFLGSAPDRPACGPLRAGLLNVARNRGRTLPAMIVLATGCFLTIGVVSMKQDPAADLDKVSSGSGGFQWMVESPFPMPDDTGDAEIRRALNHPDILAFRVHEGDEAGCLNLNHAIQPRLLGVSPEVAADAKAFDASGGEASVWALLKRPMTDDTVPVLAGDLTTVTYGLQGTADVHDGSVFVYTGEDGTTWRLRVVGALPVRTGVLQGSLIIDEAMFTRLFPSASGHGLWLVRDRSSSGENAAVVDQLRRALGRHGGLVTSTHDRLQTLGAVESTYLDMFLVLGGLGVVLGAAGMGLIMMRNAAARRNELAILRAVGLSPRRILAYLAAEHVYVLCAGLVAGIVPALVAVQPAVRSLGHGMPIGAMTIIIVAIFVSGLLGTCAAVLAVSRMRLIEALRGE